MTFSNVSAVNLSSLSDSVCCWNAQPFCATSFSAYAKSGVSKGEPFQARGMISTQFVRTPAGWRISAMAWDDERPGLTLPQREA